MKEETGMKEVAISSVGLDPENGGDMFLQNTG
jgi:hypothetical protein